MPTIGVHPLLQTLQGQHTHMFAVKPSPHSTTCPVANLGLYVLPSDRMGINLRNGYFFHATDHHGCITDAPFLSSAASNRLKKYLGQLKLDEGETVHSFRAGCSIMLSLPTPTLVGGVLLLRGTTCGLILRLTLLKHWTCWSTIAALLLPQLPHLWTTLVHLFIQAPTVTPFHWLLPLTYLLRIFLSIVESRSLYIALLENWRVIKCTKARSQAILGCENYFPHS